MDARSSAKCRSNSHIADGREVPVEVWTERAESPSPADHRTFPAPRVARGIAQSDTSDPVGESGAIPDVASVDTWCPVACHPEYEVSDQGRVRRTQTGRVLKGRLTRKGYRIVDLCVGGVHDDKTVHSLVAAAFLGPRPIGLSIDHVSGVKTDNRAVNLEYVTASENMLRSHRLKRLARDLAAGRITLDEADARIAQAVSR